MGLTVEDYLYQLQALHPKGTIWNRESDEVYTGLLTGLAEELARIDGRADDLLVQINPLTADEMLPDWEELLALPDVCSSSDLSLHDRQHAAYAKLTATGGASRQYFIDLGAALGLEIQITEYFRFKAGSKAGAGLTNDDDWRHTWRVDGSAATFGTFTAGSSAGEPLRIWSDIQLECAIVPRRPAHTKVVFYYTEEALHAQN